MNKVVRHWVVDNDDLEIEKDDIIHAERILTKDNKIMLELWCIEKS